jgi:hypothetical protein
LHGVISAGDRNRVNLDAGANADEGDVAVEIVGDYLTCHGLRRAGREQVHGRFAFALRGPEDVAASEDQSFFIVPVDDRAGPEAEAAVVLDLEADRGVGGELLRRNSR